MNFSKKNHEHHKNNSSFVSKKSKTRITGVVAVFLLSIIGVNAQINLPKNNTIKNVELKTNLKYSAPIDGIIGELVDGRYQIYWSKNSGVACCFKTLKEAVNAYPAKSLKYVKAGNRGFVYQETANNGVGKKIPNAHIAFRKQNSLVTHYAHTDKYGNYKIALLPGKYIVTIKYDGYKSFSTAPGFSVIYNKYQTFNIPLKKALKHPLRKQNNNIIAVFNTKTKKTM